MSKALEGVRILDFTHVQSGPTCTQLLAWLGADVIKVERAGEGDATRAQLRDIPDADSLYFTMLNHNKRSVTIDTKKPEGLRGARTADQDLRRAGRELRARRARPHGHHLGAHPAINPRMIVASVKGFGPGPYEDCKVYENVAQCAGGSASTTGMRRRPADGHRRADRRQRHRRCTWRSASSRRSTSARTAAAARRCSRRCRTRC